MNGSPQLLKHTKIPNPTSFSSNHKVFKGVITGKLVLQKLPQNCNYPHSPQKKEVQEVLDFRHFSFTSLQILTLDTKTDIYRGITCD